MIRILRRLKKIFKAAGVEWVFMFIYVDDYRIGLNSFKKGVTFCPDCGKLFFSLDQFRVDNKSTETDEA